MVHLVFNRPTGKLKVFGADGSLWGTLDAGGDSVTDGNPADGPYGHLWPCPPGHYVLSPPQRNDPAIVSEGAWQIPVNDMSHTAAQNILNAHHATQDGPNLLISGVSLPLGQLAQYGRAAIMLHGGGSALPDPFADYQTLCRTEGCTRLHNADLQRLVTYLSPLYNGNTVVYTIVGAPLPLTC